MRQALVVVLLLACVAGCAKSRILPDGTVETEHLDPAVIALIDRVIEQAQDIYWKQPQESVAERDRVEVLLSLLDDPELEAIARQAVEAARNEDYVSMFVAIQALRETKKTGAVPRE